MSGSVKVTYLEMKGRPAHPVGLVPGCFIMRTKDMSVQFYRFLYGSVGKDWQWVDRTKMKDTDLLKILKNPKVEIFVLYVNGQPAGFSELDRRVKGEIELAYFGIMPEFIGRGYGAYFLDWTVKKAWGYNPRRFWVHTCDLDHPAALPNYLRAGFKIYKTEEIQSA